MAVAFLTALYGIVLAEFLLAPMVQRLGARRAASGASGGTTGPSATLLMVALLVPSLGLWTLRSILP